MTKFHVSYSPNFQGKRLAEGFIQSWNSGANNFRLTTSGSTGPPKDILLSRELLIWSSLRTKAALNLKSEKVLCCLPIHKTGGFMQLIRALIFDWEIHFDEPNSRPFKNLEDSHFTLTSLTPQQIKNSLKFDVIQLQKIKKILIGGAPLDDITILQLEKLKNSYWETYGMTETASHVALKHIGTSSGYTPQNGVKISEANDILTVEIPSLNLTVKTNDLVRIHNDGSFEIIGRVDNVINSGGVKIHPTIIEKHIRLVFQEKNIQNDFYIGKKSDANLGETAVLIVEGNAIPNELQLFSFLKSKLPKHSVPREIVYVDELSFTETDKKIRLSFEQLSSHKRVIRTIKKS